MYYVTLHEKPISPALPSMEKAEEWIYTNTQTDGMLPLYYKGMHMRIHPEEVIINNKSELFDMPNNMSCHPRCPHCGDTTWHVVFQFKDDYMIEFTCGEGRMAFKHTGEKLEHCPMCSGSDLCLNHDLCPYCQGSYVS